MNPTCMAFWIYMTWKENRPFGQENGFSPRKTLKMASPKFGRSWRPNCWHQVNFRDTSEIQFKWDMWKVVGIKIETTASPRIISPKWNRNSWKSYPKILKVNFFRRGYLRNPYALRNPNILAQGPQGLQTVILNFEIFTQRPQITPDHTRSYQKHGCIFLNWALPNIFLRYPLPNTGSNPNRGTWIPILVGEISSDLYRYHGVTF